MESTPHQQGAAPDQIATNLHSVHASQMGRSNLNPRHLTKIRVPLSHELDHRPCCAQHVVTRHDASASEKHDPASASGGTAADGGGSTAGGGGGGGGGGGVSSYRSGTSTIRTRRETRRTTGSFSSDPSTRSCVLVRASPTRSAECSTT